jgi:nucleoside-diphosphate-sugar epimerase
MFPSRKKFQVNVVPSDRQLWAIGLITVQWSHLEMLIKVYMHALATDDARKQFDVTLNTKVRLRQLRDVVTERVTQPYQGEILSLIDRITGMQQERDRVIHGTWADEGVGTPERTFDYGKPRKPFEWKLTYGELVEIALKIDALNVQLLDYAFKLRTQDDDFTLGDALRRTLHKPTPG